MRSSFLIGLLFHSCMLIAQLPSNGVLSREVFVTLVLDNHPVARQAALRTDLGQASVRSSRGGFDP
nr:transporter [Flavobacteriales bacterium]